MDAALLTAIALVITAVGTLLTAIGFLYSLVRRVERAANGLTKALGEAKLAQGTAEGKAIGLEQGRTEQR